ncbi:MAG: sugar kinase [Hespellia sp.]|nr:sugar kinase [Hespellia sp.]
MKVNNPKGKIVSIGELLVEFIPVEPNLKINEEGSILKTASGSSGIFACANANICDRAAFIGKIGSDALSQFAYKVMQKEGVDLSRVVVSSQGQIGLSFLENLQDGRNFQYYRDKSVGSMFGPEDVDEEYIKSASAIHYSGMLLELSESMRKACEKCINIAKENGVLVSFDPNIRKEVMKSDDAIERLYHGIATADVIAPTLEEAQFITKKEDSMEILKELHKKGPKIIALTKDANGAILSDGKKVVSVSALKVHAIDPTGAGDTFASMLVYGIQEGWDLEKIAIYCNCAGALAVTKQGSIGRALPNMKEIEEFVKGDPCKVSLETENLYEETCIV